MSYFGAFLDIDDGNGTVAALEFQFSNHNTAVPAWMHLKSWSEPARRTIQLDSRDNVLLVTSNILTSCLNCVKQLFSPITTRMAWMYLKPWSGLFHNPTGLQRQRAIDHIQYVDLLLQLCQRKNRNCYRSSKTLRYLWPESENDIYIPDKNLTNLILSHTTSSQASKLR